MRVKTIKRKLFTVLPVLSLILILGASLFAAVSLTAPQKAYAANPPAGQSCPNTGTSNFNFTYNDNGKWGNTTDTALQGKCVMQMLPGQTATCTAWGTIHYLVGTNIPLCVANLIAAGNPTQSNQCPAGTIMQNGTCQKIPQSQADCPAGTHFTKAVENKNGVAINTCDPDAAGAAAQDANNEKVCTTGDGLSGALAWVLCPAVQLIASATNFFENNIIIPFMTVSPLTTNADNPIYILWQDIRNFANVGFIIFFFIVIFSQATSIGLSNYGIKRILPKMAFVVVGVNLSYFVVAFVIDAFNIFGAGISQLVLAALEQAKTTQLNTGTDAGAVRSIFTLGGAALLTIVVTGGAAIGWFFSFLGLALLVVVVVVIVLVVRQMAIIMLVIVAPVAILMYMLPNTENYYNKWRKTLTQLLMMYPMIVLLFAAGKIFGVILQQPDFKLAGDGVSEPVAQAIRVILQFVVYVVPLVFLPATFAASGAIMGRAYGFLHNARTKGLAQKGGKAFNEGVLKPRRAEMMERAARRGGAVGWAAGYNQRRNFKKEQRERELGRARQQYISDYSLEHPNFAAGAAGIGGAAGVTRVQAGAVSQLEKQRHEEMANESAILNDQLRSAGINSKEFNNGLTDTIQGKTSAAGSNAAKAQAILAQNPNLMRAGLNAAASAGEVGTMEQARMNSGMDQSMVDEVIRNNEGKMKEKGGYHLATNFNLAAGRDDTLRRNAAGQMLNSAGAVTADRAQAQMSSGEMNTVMATQRLGSIANTASSDIAGMKASLLDSMQKSLLDFDPVTKAPTGLSTQGASMLASMPATERAKLKTQLEGIVTNPNLIGKAQNREAIENVYSVL
jgi:hypothetical protein